MSYSLLISLILLHDTFAGMIQLIVRQISQNNAALEGAMRGSITLDKDKRIRNHGILRMVYFRLKNR